MEEKSILKICPKCGIEKPISEFYLRNKNSKCVASWCKSCMNKDNRIYYNKNKNSILMKRKIKINDSYHFYWAKSTLNKHAKRGYKISLSIKELEKIAKMSLSCPICGAVFDWSYGNKNCRLQPNSPTLDRTNNENFLSIDNIMIICYKCNITKQDKTLFEFLQYCKIAIKNIGKLMEKP